MHVPRGAYQIEAALASQLAVLSASERRGLALWVYGAVLAGSACQGMVVGALTMVGRWEAVRQYLREWLYDGADKAAPCATQLDVTACFAPLLAWVVRWWRGTEGLVLAVDATNHGDRLTALVVSVLYRGSAIPVAWHLRPMTQRGSWMTEIVALLRALQPAVPPAMPVLVLADEGLWSPRLWRVVGSLGWQALLRLPGQTTIIPHGAGPQTATRLVPTAGRGWVGVATVFRSRDRQRRGTVVIVWAVGHSKPCVVLTALPPARVGVVWYGLRMWIELGFRALKGVGWQWQRSRRTDPHRVGRHWLVLAVATLWVLATGTRIEDAEALAIAPADHHTPLPTPRIRTRPRPLSVFAHGLLGLRSQLIRHRLWRACWLLPEPWPTPNLALHIHYHSPDHSPDPLAA